MTTGLLSGCGRGDPFFVPHGVIHNARNAGTVTTMVLTTYVVDETKPLVTAHH
ncbi:hypothetical protein [Streptomyces sp. NPDC008122]|uniref:hypothetical protein n=1 Tax=Streptomyces sp. NPDC008122 TaxID=3364810 RepID=UPI0036DFDC71